MGETTRCCRQRALQSQHCVKANLGQSHWESGTWRHGVVNTASLSLEDTQGLQGYLCCYLHTHLNHDMPDTEHHWCLLSLVQSSLEKLLYSLFEDRILKQWMGKPKKTHHKIRIKSPCSLPNLPCLANSEVILCFGSDKFFSESYTLHKETSFKYAIK